MKYFVATRTNSNQYILNEFESLAQAYRFYLEDPVNRSVLKEIKVEVKEGV